MATNGLFQAHLDTDKAEQVENFRKEKVEWDEEVSRTYECIDGFESD